MQLFNFTSVILCSTVMIYAGGKNKFGWLGVDHLFSRIIHERNESEMRGPFSLLFQLQSWRESLGYLKLVEILFWKTSPLVLCGNQDRNRR